MRRPAEIPLLLHIAAHGWLGLAQVCVSACLEPAPEPVQPAAERVETPTHWPMGPNGRPMGCN